MKRTITVNIFIMLIISILFNSCAKKSNTLADESEQEAIAEVQVFSFDISANEDENYFENVYQGMVSHNRLLVLNEGDTVTFIEDIEDISSVITLENKEVLNLKSGTNNGFLTYNENEISIVSDYLGSSVNLSIYKEEQNEMIRDIASNKSNSNGSMLKRSKSKKILYDIRSVEKQRKSDAPALMKRNASDQDCVVYDYEEKEPSLSNQFKTKALSANKYTRVEFNVYIMRRVGSGRGNLNYNPTWEAARLYSSIKSVVPGIVLNIIYYGPLNIGTKNNADAVFDFRYIVRKDPFFKKRISGYERDIYLLAQYHSGDSYGGLAILGKQFAMFTVGYRDGRDYNTSSHELGHVFGAVHHSQAFWNQWWWFFGNWYSDVMTTNRSTALVNYNVHANTNNVNSINRAYINYFNRYSDPNN